MTERFLVVSIFAGLGTEFFRLLCLLLENRK